MKCKKCGSTKSVTEETIAFTRPMRGWEDMPDDQEGHFCSNCYDILARIYSVIYKPEYVSKAEALMP